MTGVPGTESERRGRRRLPRWIAALLAAGALLLFLVALRLIGSATEAGAVGAGRFLDRHVHDGLSAVGAGWLLTYGLTNGSVVAALGVTLGAAGVVDSARTLMIVAGSRLGAAAFVVLVGGIDYLRTRRRLRAALGLGILTFVVSHAVYIPATVGARLAHPALAPALERVAAALDLGFVQPGFLHALAGASVAALGPLPVVGAGIGALFLSIFLFDRALAGLDLAAVRERGSLERPWIAFGAGAGVTLLTASISFSVGALVPLFNRGALRRDEVTPYVLGANVATLADTLFVALVLASPAPAGSVLLLILSATLVSLLVLLFHEPFVGIVGAVVDGVSRTRVRFVGFLLSLLVAPALLVFLS